jgi:putative nucleotidyltransferase with HDIG domain
MFTASLQKLARFSAPGEGAQPPRVNPPARKQAQTTSGPSTRKQRWLLGVFFGVQILVAAVLIALEAPRIQGDMELLALLLALNFLTELLPIGIYGNTYFSVGFVMTMALIILFGPPAVVIAAPLEGIAGRLGRGTLDYKAVTNGARYVIIDWTCAKAFELVAGPRPLHIDAEVMAGAAVATFLSLSLAIFFVAVSVRLRTGETFRAVVAEHLWLYPHHAVLGVLGVALAAAYLSLGIPGVLAFLTPALMVRLAMKQYVDKTVENVQKLKEQNEALQKANVEIVRVSGELRESYDGTLEALVNALDARDQETKGHSLRVSRYMMDIAGQLGVKEGTQEWLNMQRGSLLHDVGKIGVSDNILLKPGKLTPEEWESMRKHPEIGYNMLRQVKFLQGAAEIILAHHERWDGAGYPNGLREEEIPLGARIFSVVDTFDSITSDRAYRRAKTTLEAMDEILRYSGSQFDPLVVEAFLDIYEIWVKEREELHGVSVVKQVA